MSQHLAILATILIFVLNTSYAQPYNLAKNQSVSADTSWSGNRSDFAVDGAVGNGNRWISDSGGSEHWLKITFPLELEFGSAHVYIGFDDDYPITSFVLQAKQGGNWVDIPGTSVTGNSETELNLIFTTSVTTSEVRFYTTESTARVKEFALYAPHGGVGYPLGTDVTINLAQQRLATRSSKYSSNYANNAVDGYVDDDSRWISGNSAGPHTLEIDLQHTSKIGSAQLYTGWGANPDYQIKNFTLQYWNGSTWIDIPGATVTNNTEFELQIDFLEDVTTSKVRLYLPDDGYQRVKELLIFPANGGIGYPLGTNVTFAPPPTKKFNNYGEDFYVLKNRVGGLVVANDEIVLKTGNASQQYQILLNVGSDTYRLRNRETEECLAVVDASQLAGAAVQEMPYSKLPHQLWRIIPTTSGYFILENVWSGLVLSIDGSGYSPGTGLVQMTADGSNGQQWIDDYVTHFPKKGLGGWLDRSNTFGNSWGYNWGMGAGGPDYLIFSPMQWGDYNWGSWPYRIPRWQSKSDATILLGFNEPDGGDQADMTSARALEVWPRLEAANVPLASPVTKNPWNNWMLNFMNTANGRGYRTDYIAVHSYGAPNAQGFIDWLEGIHNQWNKPIILSEWGVVDWNGTGSWTADDNYTYFAEVMWRFENKTWLKRYAIFVFSGSATSKRSNVYKSGNSVLTPLGELYAAWDGDQEVHPAQPYFIHNKSTHEHLRNNSGAPVGGSIQNNGDDVQWLLAETPLVNRFYIVSLADGSRLSSDGTNLSLAPPGATGTAVEWTYQHHQHGYYFIDHVGSGLRLRRYQGAFELVSTAETWNTLKWRFIKPLNISQSQPMPPLNLMATELNGVVELDWSDNSEPDLASYNVYRRDGADPDSVFALIATDVFTSDYLDDTAPNPLTAAYVVTAVNYLLEESDFSAEASTCLFTGRPDPSKDCDGDGILDTCQFSLGTAYDCNDNGRMDECEFITLGDFDADYDVDTDDVDVLLAVTGGPGNALVSVNPECLVTYLRGADADADNDCDLIDLAEIQLLFSGSNP